MNKVSMFITTICTILLPVKPLLLIVIGMVTLDTITGIYTSIKIEGRKSFKSHKLFNIVPKIFFYSITILLSFMLDKYVLDGTLFGIPFLLSKSACVLFTYIETKSIDENSQKLGNKPLMEIFKNVITGVKGIKKDINDLK